MHFEFMAEDAAETLMTGVFVDTGMEVSIQHADEETITATISEEMMFELTTDFLYRVECITKIIAGKGYAVEVHIDHA